MTIGDKLNEDLKGISEATKRLTDLLAEANEADEQECFIEWVRRQEGLK